MTKHSRFEKARRSAESERIQVIEAGWHASLSPEAQAAFRRDVELAKTRQQQPHSDMAPGTAPNPPRPGREPRQPKDPAGRRSRC